MGNYTPNQERREGGHLPPRTSPYTKDKNIYIYTNTKPPVVCRSFLFNEFTLFNKVVGPT